MNEPEAKKNYENQIEVLDSYEINNSLEEANIFHLYAKENAFPNGYFDSKFFDLHIYNTESREKRIVEHRDGLAFGNDVRINMSRVFIDGSFFIKLKNIESIDILQCVSVGKH